MTDIARGEIHIEVDDREAIAALRRIDANFDRTMSNIDRQEAEVRVTGDIRDLEKEIQHAKRIVKQLEGEKAEVELGVRKGDEEKLSAQIKEAKAKVKSLDGFKAEVEIEVQSDLDKLKATEARVKAIEAREKALTKALADQDKQRKQNLKALSDEAARRNKLETQRVRELSDAEKHAHQMERERNEVPKLERSYALLQDRLEKLATARRKARGDERATFIVDVEERETLSKIDHLRNEVRRRVGRDPIAVPVKFHASRDAGLRLRTEFLASGGRLAPTAAAVGVHLGERMGHGIVGGVRRTMDRGLMNTLGGAGRAAGASVTRGLAAGVSRIGHAAAGLADMTVRLGPFTATVRQAVSMLALLAPTALDVVGALGALVAVTGSAAVGVGALTAGFAGGLIPAAIAAVTVIKPVVGEFQNAMKASQNYAKAVREYGEGSEQAGKKQDILNNVLRNTDDRTRAIITSAGTMKDRWSKLTEPGRASAFRVMGEGLKVLTDNLDMFGAKTNTTFSAAEGSITRWFRALNSNLKGPGGGALGTMWDNFNQALPSVLDGLGNIAAYLGKIGQLASSRIPGLAATFENWSNKILGTADDMGALDKRIGKTIQSAKDIGNFFLAAGRLMKAFFSGGVDSGQSFVNTMTNAMNRWTAFLNTGPGQEKLKSFFSEAVSGVQALWSLLGPIVTAFVKWAAAIAPVARGFFAITGAVAQLTGALLSMTALRGPLTAIGATLAVLWGLGKIRAATGAVGAFVAGVRGIAASTAAATGATTANAAANVRVAESANVAAGAYTRMAAAARGAAVSQGAAGAAGAAGGAGGAARSAAQAEKAGAAARRGAAGFKAMGASALAATTGLTPMGAALLAVVGATAAAAYGIHHLVTQQKDFEKSAVKAVAASKSYSATIKGQAPAQYAAAQAHLTLAQAQASTRSAQHEVNRLAKEGKRGTDEYKQAILTLRQAKLSENQATADEKAAMDNVTKSMREANKAAEDRYNNAKKAVQQAGGEKATGQLIAYENDRRKEGLSVQQKRNELEKQYGGAVADLYAKTQPAISEMINAEANLNRSRQLAVLATLNQQRAMRGLAPIAREAAAEFAKLERRAGKATTKKIAVKFDDPKDASRVASAANRALDSGISKKRTVDIVTNSKTAEQAIRRLNRMTLEQKVLKILQQGGVPTLSMLEKLVGTKLAPKVQVILGAKADADTKIKALIALGIPPKTAKMLGNNSDALLKARQANAQRLRTLAQVIRRFINNPAGLFGRIADAVQWVQRKIKGKAMGGSAIAGYASGGIAGSESNNPRLDAVMERAQREAEEGNRYRTRRGRVTRPTFMVGEENQPEVVIAGNPAYRKQNLAYWADAGKMLGVPGFAAGGTKGPQDYGAKYDTKGPESIPEVKKYRDIQAEETDANREISIAEGRVKEPPSLIRQSGTDPQTGEPVYEVDEDALKKYSNDLAPVKQWYNTLIGEDGTGGIMARLAAAFGEATAGITRYLAQREDNLKVLRKRRRLEEKLMNEDLPPEGKTGASRRRRRNAERKRNQAGKRYSEVDDLIRDEADKRTDANDLYEDLKADNHDAAYRTREYRDARADLLQTESDMGARARSEQAATVKPQEPGIGQPGGPTAAEGRIGALDTERALAAIGQGLGGAAPRAEPDIIRDQIAAQQERIGEGQAMLRDNDPGNDLDAYGIITSAAGAIKGLTDELGTTTGAIGQQMQVLSGARGDLMRQFGGNFAVGSSLGRGAAAFGPQGPGGAFGVNQGGGPLAFGGVQKTINQTNNFGAPPPDEHTWTQGVAWELETL